MLPKGGRKRGIGHFFFCFGHLLVTFLSPFFTVLVTFLPIPFCLSPFCGRVRILGARQNSHSHSHLYRCDRESSALIGNDKRARTFFVHELFEHRQGSGTSRQKSRDIPDSSLRNPRKTNFRGRARSFRPPPLRVEDPHPTGRSPDPKISGLQKGPEKRCRAKIVEKCRKTF